MRDLVQKLPSGNPQHDHGTSDDTIAAVLATLNEVIKKHPEFSRYVRRLECILSTSSCQYYFFFEYFVSLLYFLEIGIEK